MVVFLLCGLISAQEPAKLHSVTGLEIDAPQKRTRPGLVKISAKVATAKDGQKVKILWDVSAQFEDADVDFDWEARSATQIQVIIPDTKGVILVTAWALIDGEPTSDKPAKTLIEVDYTPKRGGQPLPNPDRAPEAKKQPVAKAETKSKAKAGPPVVYLVADLDKGDDNVVAFIGSSGLKNRLLAAGVAGKDVVPVDTSAGGVARHGIQGFVDEAGGAPCAIVVRGETAKGMKLTSSTTAEEVAKLAQ